MSHQSTKAILEAQGGFLHPITDGGQLLEDGATLLDYFAANAPPPPSWFEASLPPEPERFNDDPFLNSIIKAYEFDGEWTNDIRPAKDHKSGIFFTPEKADVERAKIHWEQRKAASEKYWEWVTETKNQRDVQWPYAWARLQIAERKRVLDEIATEVEVANV